MKKLLYGLLSLLLVPTVVHADVISPGPFEAGSELGDFLAVLVPILVIIVIVVIFVLLKNKKGEK